MADRAIRDFGALPTYPPSAPHSSNKIFSTTAARAWNASPSSAASGPVSLTPSHHHHKARTSFPLAKFRPNVWEEGPSGEAKVERDLASWQTGWATDRSAQRTSSGAYQSDNPYTRSASSHAAIATSASAGSARRDRWQNESFRDDYSHYASPRGGSDHVAFPASGASASASTMTEPFGEYGSVLARVTELAAQVKHLYKLNSMLESNLQTKTRQLDELRISHEAMRGDPSSVAAKLAQLAEISAAHAALQSSHAESTAALADLLEQTNVHRAQLQSSSHALSAALAQRDQLAKAREYDAIELGKMSQLREEVRMALAESARKDEERRIAQEALVQREQQLTASEEALQARLAALATSQRLAEEAAARQSSPDHPAQPLSAAQQAEQEKLLALQSSELERLRALAASHSEAESKKIPEDHPELAAARSSVAQLQAHNTSLGAELVAREKMIADLLASSVYRRQQLAAQKEKNMSDEERVKMAKKKSSVCSIM